jgi:hypothetical protein
MGQRLPIRPTCADECASPIRPACGAHDSVARRARRCATVGLVTGSALSASISHALPTWRVWPARQFLARTTLTTMWPTSSDPPLATKSPDLAAERDCRASWCDYGSVHAYICGHDPDSIPSTSWYSSRPPEGHWVCGWPECANFPSIDPPLPPGVLDVASVHLSAFPAGNFVSLTKTPPFVSRCSYHIQIWLVWPLKFLVGVVNSPWNHPPMAGAPYCESCPHFILR